MADALFVVGYYRSGTSALSGVLQRTGVKFYNEAAPNEHNPLGFFEIPELIEFDVRLFAHLGVDWPDVRGLPEGWEDRTDITPFSTKLEEIIRRRFTAQDRLWGLKHPHLCRTLPLYERVARRAGHTPHVVHIFRDPWISAASQCYKNGLSRAHALLLWLTYTTGAERLARHLPRTWLTYQELMADPISQLQRVEAELGISLQDAGHEGFAEAASHLTNQLDRSKPLGRDALCHPLEVLVSRVWDSIQNRQFEAELWDEFTAQTQDLVGFLSEIGSSKAQALPSFGAATSQNANAVPATTQLRPLDRTDSGAQKLLQSMRTRAGTLPRLAVLIVAPAGRAYAVEETLESLRKQWEPPALIKVLTVDHLTLDDIPTIMVAAESEAMTKSLCLHIDQVVGDVDYVATLNAGDIVTPDACLRFALLAAQTKADMIYSDEIVPNDQSGWIRYKPNWDITRLRQAAYIGDWVWYRGQAVQAAGGFDPAMAGAEEYDLQLRFAAQNAHVERLTEAVFIRSPQSKRDDIPSEIFCARAVDTLSRHLSACGLAAEVQNRQYPGLFHHMRLVDDPGTSIIMFCDGAEIPTLDKWLTALLTGKPLTGPIILVGVEVSPQMQTYLTAVAAQQEALEGKVLAVMGASQGEALTAALALVKTDLVACLDARMQEVTPHWLEQLRTRLADPHVAAVAGRTITPMGSDIRQGHVMGPIILGAETRLGAGRAPSDPGPGGWLVVDQEASAITPPGLLVRHQALANCQLSPHLSGDALWIDLCAQLRADGHKLVWTPDVSFVMPPVISVDAQSLFRTGSPASKALPWSDPYHHPALSLHGDLLAAEKHVGLVRAAPPDSHSLLLTGPAESAYSVLNAARAFRLEGLFNADWDPGLPGEADLHRRAPTDWVRLNPTLPPSTATIPYTAVYTTIPEGDLAAPLVAAQKIYGTSIGLVERLRSLAPDKVPVELCRPALYGRLWQGFQPASGLNTKPRILWIDEGFAPSWFQNLMEETQESVLWIIIERPGSTYIQKAVHLAYQQNERGWVELLGAAAPQIMLRPMEADHYCDCYHTLLAAAAGCKLMIDNRLDTPATLEALHLPNEAEAWSTALNNAVDDLATTLRQGARTREVAMALPTLEQAHPGWVGPSPLVRSAQS